LVKNVIDPCLLYTAFIQIDSVPRPRAVYSLPTNGHRFRCTGWANKPDCFSELRVDRVATLVGRKAGHVVSVTSLQILSLE